MLWRPELVWDFACTVARGWCSLHHHPTEGETRRASGGPTKWQAQGRLTGETRSSPRRDQYSLINALCLRSNENVYGNESEAQFGLKQNVVQLNLIAS